MINTVFPLVSGGDRVQKPPTGFSDPDFMRLHAFIRDLRAARRAAQTGLHSAKNNIPRLATMARSIRALPQLAISVSSSQEGTEILQTLSQKRWGIISTRLAVAVLPLPANPDDYLRGRKRQAVRTNASRARASGITCAKATCGEELHRRVCGVLDDRKIGGEKEALLELVNNRSGEFWLAEEKNGETLAVAVVTVDVEVARLAWIISRGSNNRSDARYLLLAEIFTDLARRQIRYVLSDCPLFISDGLVYFQRLLGFQPMNLTVRRSGWSA